MLGLTHLSTVSRLTRPMHFLQHLENLETKNAKYFNRAEKIKGSVKTIFKNSLYRFFMISMTVHVREFL